MSRVNPINTNHFEIITDRGYFFQSYQTLVAGKLDGFKTRILKGQPQSKTTAKYLYQWLGCDNKGFKRMEKEGDIEYVDKIETE